MKNTFVTDNINIKLNGTSLALGFFDGIHIGHQKVLKNALERSKHLGTQSTVLTFRNHPVEVLYGIEPEFITTAEERIERFKAMGFDNVIMANFSEIIANMSANDYFEKIILNLSPKSISIGYNHRFGANQSGDVSFLNEMGKKYGFVTDVATAVKQKNEITSSTVIRNAIKGGCVEKALLLLGKPYKIKNIVIHGAQRGRKINFPTANIEFPKTKIIPKFGVYSGNTAIDGKIYKSIANIGLRPTYSDIKIPLAEINIFNFDKDIYGKNIEFEFLNFIRQEYKFNTEEKLIEQIKKDIVVANKLLS